MPPRKCVENTPPVEVAKASSWQLWELIAAITSLAAVILAVPPVYWSYLCRSHGEFCEGSFAAPSVTDESKDRLDRRLTSLEGQVSFDGLAIKRRGVWLFGHRLDVVAKFKDGSELTIDVLPAETKMTEIYNAPTYAAAVIPEIEDGQKGRSVITAYFLQSGVTKRTFAVQCAQDEIRNVHTVSISNFAYLPAMRRMLFDVISSCRSISLNANAEIDLRKRDWDTTPPFGSELRVELSETLHLAAAFTETQEREYLDARAALAQCRDRAIVQADKIAGELWACYQSRSDKVGARVSKVTIYEWDSGALNEVDSIYGNNSIMKSKHKMTIFAVNNGIVEKTSAINIIKKPYERERYYRFEGECKQIYIWQPDYTDDGRHIEFELDTDCNEITVNDRNFSISVPTGMKKLERCIGSTLMRTAWFRRCHP